MNLEIGSLVGDYQVVGILGAGGMGKVYKVRNVISDRIEAMKVLLPDLVNEPDLADRFLREIKVQASLEHPNIAALHTAVREENQLLMLMEFVEGVTLDQRLKDGPLPVAEAVDYMRQVLAALEYAHARGVVHRDIKPANMMLTPVGVVKLMDFGIAKASADHKLTMTGTTIGSLYYMSPEQIQGVTALDARSDLYSVGVSLYELVTGKRPFDGDSQFAIMSAHLEKTPVPPITIDPRLPQLLNDVILMSVAKDPNARFQTAVAVRNALSNVFAEVKPQTAAPTVAAVPVGQPARTVQPASHRAQWMVLGAVAAVLAIVAVVAIAPWKGSGAAPSRVAAPAVQPAPSQPPAPVAAPPAAAAGIATSATGRARARASSRDGKPARSRAYRRCAQGCARGIAVRGARLRLSHSLWPRRPQAASRAEPRSSPYRRSPPLPPPDPAAPNCSRSARALRWSVYAPPAYAAACNRCNALRPPAD